MKKTYLEAELEIVNLAQYDVVTMSTYGDGGDDDGWGTEKVG